MSADELLVQLPRDRADVVRALLAAQLRVQRDLQQQISELVPLPRHVAGVERRERFVGLLEQMRPERRVGLLAVPGTTVRRAQPLGDPRDRRERGEIGERLEWRKHEEAGATELALGVSERAVALAFTIQKRDGLVRGIARAEEAPIGDRVEHD